MRPVRQQHPTQPVPRGRKSAGPYLISKTAAKRLNGCQKGTFLQKGFLFRRINGTTKYFCLLFPLHQGTGTWPGTPRSRSRYVQTKSTPRTWSSRHHSEKTCSSSRARARCCLGSTFWVDTPSPWSPRAAMAPPPSPFFIGRCLSVLGPTADNAASMAHQIRPTMPSTSMAVFASTASVAITAQTLQRSPWRQAMTVPTRSLSAHRLARWCS